MKKRILLFDTKKSTLKLLSSELEADAVEIILNGDDISEIFPTIRLEIYIHRNEE